VPLDDDEGDEAGDDGAAYAGDGGKEGDGDGEGDDSDGGAVGGVKIRVPTHGPDGRKLTRKEREREKRRLKRLAKAAAAHGEAPPEVADMDAEAEASVAGTKRKRKADNLDPESLASELVEAAPEQRGRVSELLDELYSVNYEDVVGGQPMRFRYRKVKADSYGLTPLEILLADERDLNAHVSIKKLTPYRPPEVQERDRTRLSKAKRVARFRERLRAALAAKEAQLAEIGVDPTLVPALKGVDKKQGDVTEATDAVPAPKKAPWVKTPGTGKHHGGAARPPSKAARKAVELGLSVDRLQSYQMKKKPQLDGYNNVAKSSGAGGDSSSEHKKKNQRKKAKVAA